MQRLLQSWESVGCVTPSLISKMFSPKKLSKLILYRRKKKGSSNRERPILDASLAGTPKRASADLRPYNLGLSEPAAPRRHSDYQGSPPRSSILGRISDAGGMIFPRLSTSSSSCYERLSVEYHGGGGGGQVLDLPSLVKLGAFSDESGHLQRQDSSMSMTQQRRSSCSAVSFMSSTSSKLKEVYAQQRECLMRDNQLEQPHIGQLFAGNQFLTHLVAAPPVPAYVPEHAFIEPSPGLLDASLRCRDAELKDRIILFL